jgi:hypothetical protein
MTSSLRLLSGFQDSSSGQPIFIKGNIPFFGLPKNGPILWVHVAKAFVPLECFFVEENSKTCFSSYDPPPTSNQKEMKTLLPEIPSEEWCAISFPQKKKQKVVRTKKNKDKRKKSRLPKRVKYQKYIQNISWLFQEEEEEDDWFDDVYSFTEWVWTDYSTVFFYD